jgi:hypothetical protein
LTTFIARQESFICAHCGKSIEPLAHGSYRNHCPYCLYSLHVDKDGPGDRASTCLSLMRPDHVDHDGKKGWLIIHVCNKCNKTIPNKAAEDDCIIEFMERKSEIDLSNM